jgi:hypothetical protein
LRAKDKDVDAAGTETPLAETELQRRAGEKKITGEKGTPARTTTPAARHKGILSLL